MVQSMKVLVTGGAGYIGSHTVVELLHANYEVVVLDSLVNSSIKAIDRTQQITNKSITFIEGDIRDRQLLDKVFQDHDVLGVIHFAGLKAVGESVQKPLEYFETNVSGSINLIQAAVAAKVPHFVFSSSATVYGPEASVPYIETMPLGSASNPYGASKIMVEQVLSSTSNAVQDFTVTLLRYFNPIGAHSSRLIGEDPKGIPNNLLPFVTQVAVGKREKLSIYGDDYPTKDGSCVRDYVHVVDLAKGHVKALISSINKNDGAVHIYNLGTGKGVSVKQIVHSFESISGKKIPYSIVNRRAGDLPEFWADASKAQVELGWYAEHSLDEMLYDAWNWQKENPDGYGI
jgi:UDP-glucose 4-epimerase